MIRFLPFILNTVIFTAFFLFSPLQAEENPSENGKCLYATYSRFTNKLTDNDFGVPLHLESHIKYESLAGDVYGVIDYAFSDVKKALRVPANWCDIASLHINIKASTHQIYNDTSQLVFYSGRKFYQPPEDAFQVKYFYRIPVEESDYIKIILSAEHGPMGTSDYLILLEATPISKNRTFVHFSYSYNYGFAARMAMFGYLTTIGNGKVGFSVVGTDETGNNIYVDGLRGVIERNVIRYYLAIQAYMDALKYPQERQFFNRICRWFDLTDKYPKQLYEMSRDNYIQYKTLEYENQKMLQAGVLNAQASLF